MIYYSTKSRDWFADHSLDTQPVTAWIGGQVRHPIGRESNTLELRPRTHVLTRLLTVGGDDPRKGVDQLILDLSDMPGSSKSQYEVLVAGTSIRRRERRNGLRVISLGRIDAASMQAAYRRADIALIASNREPWGFVFNEAILAGRPCVVSDHAGAATLAGRYGLAYTPGDSASLYRALERARKITPIELSQIASEISVAKSATSFRAFLRDLNMSETHTIQDY
jgi:glycosyltransferase involved in cell wall biosynthesis